MRFSLVKFFFYFFWWWRRWTLIQWRRKETAACYHKEKRVFHIHHWICVGVHTHTHRAMFLTVLSPEAPHCISEPSSLPVHYAVLLCVIVNLSQDTISTDSISESPPEGLCSSHRDQKLKPHKLRQLRQPRRRPCCFGKEQHRLCHKGHQRGERRCSH